MSCECLMDDHDFSSNMNRADFLEMCKPMMQKVGDSNLIIRYTILYYDILYCAVLYYAILQ